MEKLNKLKNLLFISGICCFLTACNYKDSLPAKEYLYYLGSDKSELYLDKITNKIKFICKLQTPELITLHNTGTVYKSPAEFEKEKSYYSDKLNFVFLIQDEKPEDHLIKKAIFKEDLYSQLLAYAHSELQKDFSLQLADETIIPCSFVHLEPANSINPVIRLSVAFENVSNTNRSITLIFDDNLFNNGKLKFYYDKEIFDALPKLKI